MGVEASGLKLLSSTSSWKQQFRAECVWGWGGAQIRFSSSQMQRDCARFSVVKQEKPFVVRR